MNLRLDTKILKLWPKLVDHYNIAYKNKVIDGEMWTGTTPSGIKVKGWLEPKTTVYPLY